MKSCVVQESLFPERDALERLSEWLPRKLWMADHGDEDFLGVSIPVPLVRDILDILGLPHQDTEPKVRPQN